MKSTEVVRALAALAQESRLAVYRLLVARGPQGLSAGIIADKLGILPATLSFHLKELANAGLITALPQGRFVIYSANFDSMSDLVGFLTDNCCGGNPCASISARTAQHEPGGKANV